MAHVSRCGWDLLQATPALLSSPEACDGQADVMSCYPESAHFVLDGQLPLRDVDARGVLSTSCCPDHQGCWLVEVANDRPLCKLLSEAALILGIWDVPGAVLSSGLSTDAFLQARGLDATAVIGIARDTSRSTKERVLVLQVSSQREALAVHAHFEGCSEWEGARPVARPLLTHGSALDPPWHALVARASPRCRDTKCFEKTWSSATQDARPDPRSPLWIVLEADGARAAQESSAGSRA